MELKTMKWMLMALAVCLAGCGGSEDTPDENRDGEKLEEIVRELCGGHAFVEYEMDSYSALGATYRAPVQRKAYVFKADGTGELTTFTFNNSDRGHIISDAGFTWRKDGDEGISIKEGTVGSYSVSGMKLTDTGVSFVGGEWEKEVAHPAKLKKEDVISYRLDNLKVWLSTITDEFGYTDPVLWATPAILTLKTKQGIVRLFNGIVPGGARYDSDGTFYMATSAWESAYDIFVGHDGKDFDGAGTNWDNWIKLAEVKDRKIVSCLEEGKEYKLE